MSQQINLFNVGFERKKSYVSTPVLAAGIGALVLVLAGMSALAKARLAALETEAATVKASLANGEKRKSAATAAFVAPRKSEALQQQLDQAGVELRNLQRVAGILEHPGRHPATPAQVRHLAAVVHLCGAGAAAGYARRGFQFSPGQRCGDHDPRDYLARVDAAREVFARLAAQQAVTQ